MFVFTVAGAVERYDVQQRSVSPGNEGDQRRNSDRHVLEGRPQTHDAPPALTDSLRVFEVVVAAVFAVFVLVFPKRDQVDDGRTEQAQNREENCPEQRYDRGQVRHDGSNADYRKYIQNRQIKNR